MKKKSKNFNAVIKRPNSPRQKRRFFIKKTQRVARSRVLYFTLFLCFIFIGLVYYLFFTDQFLIKNFTVEGATATTEQEIFEYFEEFSNQKRFFVLRQNKTVFFPTSVFTENLLRDMAKLKKAEGVIGHPNSLSLSVEERSQEGIWCAYGSNTETPDCFFYDAGGVIYEPAPSSARGSLIKIIRDARYTEVQFGDTVMDENILTFTNNLTEALGLIYQRPSYIFIKNNDEIHAGFSVGWEAYFSRSQELIASIENLVLILEEEIGDRENQLEYIDLRLGDRVFYKYK